NWKGNETESGNRVEAERQKEKCERGVRRMSAHDVTHFVAEQHALLRLIQNAERSGVYDYERLCEADRHRIDERSLRNEQIRTFRPVECFQDFHVQRMEPGPLAFVDAHGIRREQLRHSALA